LNGQDKVQQMQVTFDLTVLLFAAGAVIGAVRPKIRFPRVVSRLLSLYLLIAIGIKGGAALAGSELNLSLVASIAAGLVMALVVPVSGFFILKRVTSHLNAAAIAAAYGSVSVVTFVTAVQSLELSGTPYGGYMTAVLALMESPAIFMAILLAAAVRGRSGGGDSGDEKLSVRHALREALTDRTQLLLIASFVLGALLGTSSVGPVALLLGDGFRLVLAAFLFDMGAEVARQFPMARRSSRSLLAYAVCAPPAHAALALLLSALLGFGVGDATLLMVLSASASYIVVPAVIRHAIPEANPALYLGLSLGVTFPFNIVFGIPVYSAVAKILLG
jgi:hypothetical protein